MMRSLRSTVVVLLLTSCSSHSSSIGGDPERDASVVVDLSETSYDDLPSALQPCPSNILCGNVAACCPLNTECYNDACVAPCSSGVHCAGSCCNAGSVCLSQTCVVPGADCLDSLDCDDSEFCEPTLDKCLPEPTGAMLCEYKPPVATYEPVVKWSWTSSSIMSTSLQVINAPAVADLDADGIPDVVIVTSVDFDATHNGYLRALDGKTGLEKWPSTAGVYVTGNEVNPRGTPAIADIDNDGQLEIVSPKKGGGLIAFRADGSLLWKSTNTNGTAYNATFGSVTVAIADMDNTSDHHAEIVAGGVVFDYTGKVISGAGRELAGSNVTNYGAVSIIADVNGDGKQDVVTGRAAHNLNGTAIWDCSVTPFCGASAALHDGYAAISDLDGDGAPELVVIANGQVRVQEAATGALKATLALPGSGAGGPPTIADFDADGVMEISSANGNMYNVFEYSATPTPTLSVKWSSGTQDLSSNVTGSSVFDFEGDGAAEVVYGDECFFRVYSGADGTIKFQTPSSSATIHEFPVVVDVDGDNRTEVVVVSNNLNHLNGTVTCPTYASLGASPRTGVFVYGDAHNKWVRTRKLWNQHAYHVSNVNADGTLPAPELASWLPPSGLNNYRVSTQGTGVYNAPDLTADLSVGHDQLPDLTHALGAREQHRLARRRGGRAGFVLRGLTHDGHAHLHLDDNRRAPARRVASDRRAVSAHKWRANVFVLGRRCGRDHGRRGDQRVQQCQQFGLHERGLLPADSVAIRPSRARRRSPRRSIAA